MLLSPRRQDNPSRRVSRSRFSFFLCDPIRLRSGQALRSLREAESIIIIRVHHRSSFGSAQDGVCGSKPFNLRWAQPTLRDPIRKGIVRKIGELLTSTIDDPPFPPTPRKKTGACRAANTALKHSVPDKGKRVKSKNPCLPGPRRIPLPGGASEGSLIDAGTIGDGPYFERPFWTAPSSAPASRLARPGRLPTPSSPRKSDEGWSRTDAYAPYGAYAPLRRMGLSCFASQESVR